MSFKAYGFPTRKAAGEWVEAVFMVKALALGLGVSKPFGDSQPYDLLVTRNNLPPVRVQVKSAFAMMDDRYRVAAHGSGGPYNSADFDFLVAYLPLQDVWYIVPMHQVDTPCLSLCPHRDRGRFERYREAWGLLTGDPEDTNRLLGFTIHAQAAT